MQGNILATKASVTGGTAPTCFALHPPISKLPLTALLEENEPQSIVLEKSAYHTNYRGDAYGLMIHRDFRHSFAKTRIRHHSSLLLSTSSCSSYFPRKQTQLRSLKINRSRNKRCDVSGIHSSVHLSPQEDVDRDEDDEDDRFRSTKGSEYKDGSSITDNITGVIINALLYPVPTPFLPPFESSTLALAYPLVLFGAYAFLSLPTSLTISAFFLAYLIMGRTLALEDNNYDRDDIEAEWDGTNNNNALDLAALVGSIVSSGLLLPSGLGIRRDDTAVITASISPQLVIGFTIIALVGVTIITKGTDILAQDYRKKKLWDQEKGNKNDDPIDDSSRQLLDLWDEKLARFDQKPNDQAGSKGRKEHKQNRK